MLVSDIIQLCSVMVAVFIGIVSIIISVVTLKQNSKMIEESTRPNITIYADSIYIITNHLYLIIKNFGKSTGKIISFTCNYDLREYVHFKDTIPFSDLNGFSLVSQQKIYAAFDVGKMLEDCISNLTFIIEYESELKVYSEKIDIDISTYANLEHLRIADCKEEDKNKYLVRAFQDYIEKQL